MGAILVRLLLLALGLATLEQALPPALILGGAHWLAVAAGFTLVIAGSAGFMGQLLEDARRNGGSGDAA